MSDRQQAEACATQQCDSPHRSILSPTRGAAAWDAVSHQSPGAHRRGAIGDNAPGGARLSLLGSSRGHDEEGQEAAGAGDGRQLKWVASPSGQLRTSARAMHKVQHRGTGQTHEYGMECLLYCRLVSSDILAYFHRFIKEFGAMLYEDSRGPAQTDLSGGCVSLGVESCKILIYIQV